MDVEELMVLLTDKDKQQAYGALQALERISEQSDVLYSYTRQFAAMVKSEQYMLRVRGFRLFCKQARWDKEEVIDETIVQVLTILQDEKPIAVRQALAALQEVVRYKPARYGSRLVRLSALLMFTDIRTVCVVYWKRICKRYWHKMKQE